MNSSRPNEDDLLTRILNKLTRPDRPLYTHQEEAILELCEDKHVVLKTPTGSGKSLVALAAHEKGRCTGVRSYYTSPIKALVSEKFFQLCETFGNQYVGMQTGDASIHPTAEIICCTAEVLSRMTLQPALQQEPCIVVMDEFHYYSDSERGVHWQLPLITLPKAQFLLMSATLGDLDELRGALELFSQRKVAEVVSFERPIPLHFKYQEQLLHEAIAEQLANRLVPIYVVQFTQRACIESAMNCLSIDCTSKEEKKILKEELTSFRFDTPFGAQIRKLLLHGIAVHHAGLLPKYRLLVERLSQKGLLKIIFGTDTLGVGINVPIRTVIFVALNKFDGKKNVLIDNQQFMQIAGRAGRAGYDSEGDVIVLAPEHLTLNRRAQSRLPEGRKKSKFVPQKPPKNFIAWDANTLEKLCKRQYAVPVSRFQVDAALLLDILNAQPSNYRYLVELIGRCHDRPAVKKRHLRQAAHWARRLSAAGLIENKERGLYLHPDLQKEFSLHQGLVLYVIHCLENGFYTQEEDVNSWEACLDCISLVECVLDQPFAILNSQRQVAKKEKLAELRGQDIDYAERMHQLEQVEYPKPNADLLYDAFHIYREKHPYLKEENIYPKSIGREMFENYYGFNEYIKRYQLQTSEGILLRYLNSLYKSLQQTVPQSFWSEPLSDAMAYFYQLVKTVDQSLWVAWERLSEVEESAVQDKQALLSQKMQDLEKRKQWQASVQFMIYSFSHALARKDYAQAREDLTLSAQEKFTEERLESYVLQFESSYGAINTKPASRKKNWTHWQVTEDRVYIEQTLIDMNEEAAGVIKIEIAPYSAESSPEERVLLELIELL